MKFRLHYFIRFSLFWLFYFLLFRLCFLIYHRDRLPDGDWGSFSFIAALRLDISAICYMAVLSYFLWTIQQFYRSRLVHRINLAYMGILVCVVTVICLSNIIIYKEWGTLLNYRALRYLEHPSEIVSFISLASLTTMICCLLLFIVSGIFIYRKWMFNFSYTHEKLISRMSLIVLLPVLLFTGIRGGWQQIPVNESAAYYSSSLVNNHAATNPVWYLIHSVMATGKQENIYRSMDPAVAQERVDSLFKIRKQPVEKILNASAPNIVIIVLESWTADIIRSLGGEENVTPCFDTLRKEGLLFSNAYANGTRTDQGLVSILSGFPTVPHVSIMMVPEKAQQLPSILRSFSNKGYGSSFYYGGELAFANMKGYLLTSGFEKMIDKESFTSDEQNSKWGAHDEFVLKRQAADLDREKQPFFSVLLTLSTHEPFEVPMETPFKGASEEDKFRKAAYYTDRVLGDYFREVRKKKWYSNTLFVLVADHGHRLPGNRDLNFPEAKHITLLLYGEVLKGNYRGKAMDVIVGQNDLAATLLGQMEMDHSNFKWSRDVMDTSAKQFAYYSNENVLGWVVPGKRIVYSHSSGNMLLEEDSEALADARAYLQLLYQEYLSY